MNISNGNSPNPASGFPFGAKPTLLVNILQKLPVENQDDNNKCDKNIDLDSEAAKKEREKSEPEIPLTKLNLPLDPKLPVNQGPGYLTHEDIPVEIKSLPIGEPDQYEIEEDHGVSAPELSTMDTIVGYETTSFDDSTHPPPSSYMLLMNNVPPQRETINDANQISLEQAKVSLLQHVSSHCCYGNKAAKDMEVSEVINSMAFHYSLNTFTEERQTSWTYSAHTGGMVDTSMNGPAPGPWEVAVQVPKCFQDSVVQTEIPHTASIKKCHMCTGHGRKKCNRCYGHGYERCDHCAVDVIHDNDVQDRCDHCHGHGKKQCWKCNGQGIKLCSSCQSTGQLKFYIKLTVSWSCNFDEEVVDTSDLPNNLIKSVTGQTIFEEDQANLWPISNFSDDRVNDLSSQILQKHKSSYSSRRILRQRHQLKIIPVTKICYNWKDSSGIFCVYGNERKVYAPDYPQTCCCGLCTIL